MCNLENIFAGLILYRHNIQLMHWNTIGCDFDPAHEKLGDYVDTLNDYIDEVAEIMKMLDCRPMCLEHVLECVKNTKSADFLYLDGDTDFTSQAIWENVSTMFKGMVELYENTISLESFPGDIVSKLQEHQHWFRVEGIYKGNARLKK